MKTIKEQVEDILLQYEDGDYTTKEAVGYIDDLYTDPSKHNLPKLLGNLLEKAVEYRLDHDCIPYTYVDDLEEFLEGYSEEVGENGIIIDCKQDSAIPKESLQENLQLLIDRIGVIELNKLVEGLVERTEGNTYTSIDIDVFEKTINNPPKPNQALVNAAKGLK